MPDPKMGELLVHTAIYHYRIIANIGKGRVSQQKSTYDTRLGREVAIKVMPPYIYVS